MSAEPAHSSATNPRLPTALFRFVVLFPLRMLRKNEHVVHKVARAIARLGYSASSRLLDMHMRAHVACGTCM